MLRRYWLARRLGAWDRQTYVFALEEGEGDATVEVIAGGGRGIGLLGVSTGWKRATEGTDLPEVFREENGEMLVGPVCGGDVEETGGGGGGGAVEGGDGGHGWGKDIKPDAAPRVIFLSPPDRRSQVASEESAATPRHTVTHGPMLTHPRIQQTTRSRAGCRRNRGFMCRRVHMADGLNVFPLSYLISHYARLSVRLPHPPPPRPPAPTSTSSSPPPHRLPAFLSRRMPLSDDVP